MAKVKNPLFSIYANGQIALSLIYQSNFYSSFVKKYSVPSGLPSLSQSVFRQDYGNCTSQWKFATQFIISHFNSLSSGKSISGFNYYVKQSLFVMNNPIYNVAIFNVSYYAI